MKTITVISAPGIPVIEAKKFRRRWDKNRRVVAENFEFTVERVQVPKGSKLLVTAPDVPILELKVLRKHVREALKDPSYTVVVNYDCHIDVLPA